MLRKLAIFPLLLAYLAMTCRVAVPVVNYVVNHEAYQERCENKAKPELECDGCCQVKKEIAENADDEQSSENSTNSRSQRTNASENLEPLYLISESIHLQSPETATKPLVAAIPAHLLFGVGTVPFQPPRA